MFNQLFSKIRRYSYPALFWVAGMLVLSATLLVVFPEPPAASAQADQPTPPPPTPILTPSEDTPSADTESPAPSPEPDTDAAVAPVSSPSPEPTAVTPTLDSGPLQPIVDSVQARPLLIIGAIGIITLLFLLLLWLRRRRSSRSSVTPQRQGIIPPAAAGSAPLSPQTEPPSLGTPYLRSEGHAAGTAYYPLTQSELTIGRGPESLLQIDETFKGGGTVSRNHARIEREERGFVLLDEGSANGVYVNGQRSGTNLLRDGVTISIGDVPFTFHMNQRGEAT